MKTRRESEEGGDMMQQDEAVDEDDVGVRKAAEGSSGKQ